MVVRSRSRHGFNLSGEKRIKALALDEKHQLQIVVAIESGRVAVAFQ